MQLQKEVKSNPKQPHCKKKRCADPKRPLWKKMWNPRWQSRNGCDGRLMTKILITTIQVNLVPNPSETRQKFTWIVVIKNFVIIKILSLAYHHSHFLAATLDFTSFFHNALFGAAHFFFTAGLFWVRLNCTIDFTVIWYILYVCFLSGSRFTLPNDL